MRNLFIILTCIGLMACGGGVSDMMQHLGNGYYYIDESATKKYLIYRDRHSGDTTIVPSTILAFNFNDDFIVVKQKSNREEEGSTLSYQLLSVASAFRMLDSPNVSNRLVYVEIAQKHAGDSNLYKYINSKISIDNTFEDQQFLKAVADSLISVNSINDGGTHYLIVLKKEGKVYGPYEKQEFNVMRSKLNVPSQLQLAE